MYNHISVSQFGTLLSQPFPHVYGVLFFPFVQLENFVLEEALKMIPNVLRKILLFNSNLACMFCRTFLGKRDCSFIGFYNNSLRR